MRRSILMMGARTLELNTGSTAEHRQHLILHQAAIVKSILEKPSAITDCLSSEFKATRKDRQVQLGGKGWGRGLQP